MVFLMFNDIDQPNVDVGKPNMVFLMFNDIEQHELKKEKMPINRSSRVFNRLDALGEKSTSFVRIENQEKVENFKGSLVSNKLLKLDADWLTSFPICSTCWSFPGFTSFIEKTLASFDFDWLDCFFCFSSDVSRVMLEGHLVEDP